MASIHSRLLCAICERADSKRQTPGLDEKEKSGPIRGSLSLPRESGSAANHRQASGLPTGLVDAKNLDCHDHGKPKFLA
jgi:hypothetical protein